MDIVAAINTTVETAVRPTTIMNTLHTQDPVIRSVMDVLAQIPQSAKIA